MMESSREKVFLVGEDGSVSVMQGSGAPTPRKEEKESDDLLEEEEQVTMNEANAHFFYSSNGDVDSLEALVGKRGKGILNEVDEVGTTLLCLAVNKGHLDMCRYLLLNNVPVDQSCGPSQATPLHFAIHRELFEICVLLLRHGANLQKRDIHGNDALLIATMAGRVDMVALFLANGADVESRDKDGCTALILASQRVYCLHVCYCLIAFDASINTRDNLGNTALHYAAKEKLTITVVALIKNGASPTAENEEGLTPHNLIYKPPPGYFQDPASFRPTNILKKLVPSRSSVSVVNTFSWLHTDPLRKTLVITLPFIIFCCAIWLGNYVLVHPFLGLFVLGPLVAFFAGAVSISTFTYKVRPSPFSMGFYLSSVCIFTVVALKIFIPLTKEDGTPLVSMFMTLVIFADLFLFIFTFYKTHANDPGIIHSSRRNRSMVINRLADENCLNLTHFCPSCLIRKPLRSKHCAVLDRCIAKFDHFCPFVDNTIGANNHKYFILNLFSCILANVIFLYYCIQCLRYLSPPESYLWLPIQWFKLSPMLVLMLIQDVGTIFLLNGLLSYQLRIIFLQDLTTNEAMHPSRYSYLNGERFSPWHKGLVSNCFEFFFGKTDWKTMFEAPEPALNKSLVMEA
eukprot:m.46608 g.46608  ORF g.46608 m.46608 type:complete len:628 (+) comp7279_c0_seq3:65-1948(+)